MERGAGGGAEHDTIHSNNILAVSIVSYLRLTVNIKSSPQCQSRTRIRIVLVELWEEKWSEACEFEDGSSGLCQQRANQSCRIGCSLEHHKPKIESPLKLLQILSPIRLTNTLFPNVVDLDIASRSSCATLNFLPCQWPAQPDPSPCERPLRCPSRDRDLGIRQQLQHHQQTPV